MKKVYVVILFYCCHSNLKTIKYCTYFIYLLNITLKTGENTALICSPPNFHLYLKLEEVLDLEREDKLLKRPLQLFQKPGGN